MGSYERCRLGGSGGDGSLLATFHVGTLGADRSLSESDCVNATPKHVMARLRSLASRSGVAVAFPLAMACALVPADVAAQDKSTQDGVFSQDQAKSGEETFERVCAACHQSEQFGEAFLQSWAGATVGDLFDLVSALMPEDQPGSLEPAEYVAVLSYIFQLNGLPPGPSALGEQREILGSIRIEN